MTQNHYLDKLKKIILDSLKNDPVKIILFGSRARGDNNHGSDVDIGIIPNGKWESKKLVLLRERIEQMNIPYKVDVVLLSETSGTFKSEVLKGAVVWKD